MKAVTSWWSEINGSKNQWLILGKGPTFGRRGEFDLTPFRTVAINHVVREMPVDVALANDVDVIRDCGNDIIKNAKVLLVPRFLHINGGAAPRPVETFFDELPALKTMDKEGRLVWYNLASAREAMPGCPVVPFGFFSAEVIVTLLAMLGARKIRTLGVDGGKSYDSKFNDLNDKTKLINGHDTFDKQWKGIADAIFKYNLEFGPLTSQVPMKIFIGTDESQVIGAKVFEYTVRKHSTISAEFDTMMHVQTPFPKDPMNQPRTGFSFSRFAIPKLCGYKGRAVYVDADMQIFRDFRELWDMPFNGAKVLHCAASDPNRPKQFSVLLLDCEALKWDPDKIVNGLDEGKYNYEQLMKHFCIVPESEVRDAIPAEWNSLEEYVPGKTGLIHYTDMDTQPWVYRDNKNGDVWVNELRNAIRDGFISMEELKDAVKKGYARPSLYWQLICPRRFWPVFLRTVGRRLDRRFRPHQKLFSRRVNVK